MAKLMGSVYVLICMVSAYAVALLVGGRQRSMLPWLLAGVTLRVAMLVCEMLGLWVPPQSTADAASFIRRAHELSGLPWTALLAALDYRSTYSYAVTGAALFKVIGYHDYAMQATNVVAGTINICLASWLVRRYVSHKAATGAAALLCLYPFAAFNSIVALREEFGILFFLLGLACILQWSNRGNIGPFLLGNVLFVFASFVHPGFIGAVIATTGFFMFSAFQDMKRGGNQRNAIVTALVGFMMFLGAVGVFASGVELGKGVELTLDPDAIAGTVESKFQRESMGGSAYPSMVAQGNPFTQPWLIPARIAYFLYSPFIWDVRSAIHISGVLVGFFYMWLSIRAWRAWRAGMLGGRMRVLVWIFIAMTLIFSLGTSNSGTAIRHKTKFFPLLVILAAPTFRRGVVIGRPVYSRTALAENNRPPQES